VTTVQDYAAAAYARLAGLHQASITYYPPDGSSSSTFNAWADPPITDGGALGVDGPARAARRFLVSAANLAAPAAGGQIDDGDGRGRWRIDGTGIKSKPGSQWLLTTSRPYLYGSEV